MQLTDIFLRLGPDHFDQLLRSISIGRLKTFQLYERMKLRLHLPKLNSESLRKSAPRLWKRFEDKDETLATELSQCILISHMDMIKAALDHLGIEHEEGFFSKDSEVADHLKEGWQQAAWDALKDSHPHSALLFYINHLGFEAAKLQEVFLPAA
ncbi:MAG: hypothetical protein ABI824_03245 [Acidobacteriota bacterium]